MYQALYRKYRPKNFNEVVGQEVVIKTLKNAIVKDKISHAYLFAGPRGCGKTTIAKIFAKLVNCKNPQDGVNCGQCVCCTQTDDQNMDIIEMDAASNNGVDEIREINNKVKLAPTLGKYKIYIIDEVHMLTIGAFNALLKTLEEPPSHVIFILATTDPHKVPITILSRCQRFDLKKISSEKIQKRLKFICDEEKIKIEDDALIEIARLGDGCLRDSIGILDQVISYADDEVTVNDIYEVNGTISQNDVYELINNVVNNKLNLVIEKITDYSNNGKSIIKIAEEIILFLRNTILCATTNDYQEKIYQNIKDKISVEKLLLYIRIMNDSLLDMKKFSNTKMLLELAFIKIISNSENEKEKIKELNISKNKNELINYHKEEFKEEIKITNSIKSTDSDETKFKEQVVNDSAKKIEEETMADDKLNIIDNNTNFKKTITDEEKENIIKKLQQFVNIRVNNTLSSFSKKQTIEERKRIKLLENYEMDEKYNNYVTMLLDGELKAVGNNYIIFTYATKNLANLFNENINKLENTIKEILKVDYKLVAVSIDSWNIIKDEFNNKTRKFIYQEETININDELSKLNQDKDDMKSLFGDIVEYK